MNSNSILKRLFSYARPYRIYLIGALISAMISVVFSLLIPVFVGKAVDFIVGAGNVDFSGLLNTIIYLALFISCQYSISMAYVVIVPTR